MGIILCDLTPTKDFFGVIESNWHILIIIMMPKERENEKRQLYLLHQQPELCCKTETGLKQFFGTLEDLMN